MSAHRPRRRAGVLALAAVLSVPVGLGVSAEVVGAAGPGPAAAAPCKVVRQGKAGSTSNLQSAIDAAPAGAVLIVTGTCVGDFTIDRGLTIRKGAKPATLRGGGGTTVTVKGAPVVLSELRITGGRASECPQAANVVCGGGVLNQGVLTLINARVDGNEADGGLSSQAYGGGLINHLDATLRLIDSTVTGNVARVDFESAGGGGIYNVGTLVISRSRITGNHVTAKGAYAGGIFQDGGTMTITDSTIAGNVVTGIDEAQGGGLLVDDDAVIRRSLIAGNKALIGTGLGGGLKVGTVASLTITDSTITGNQAKRGGGLDITDPVTILGSTIARNLANSGGGIAGNPAASTIGSTIIATNVALSGPDCQLTHAAVSAGGNLVGKGDGCTAFANGTNGDRVGSIAVPLDPKLGKLAANGGPTKTLALLTGSPAINKAGSAPCDTKTDQRRVKRPQLGRCDIGAYEKR